MTLLISKRRGTRSRKKYEHILKKDRQKTHKKDTIRKKNKIKPHGHNVVRKMTTKENGTKQEREGGIKKLNTLVGLEVLEPIQCAAHTHTHTHGAVYTRQT